MAKLGTSVTANVKNNIWTDITKSVNATGSGQLRTLDQVKLHRKNLKQKTTKDQSECQNRKTGNKQHVFQCLNDVLKHRFTNTTSLMGQLEEHCKMPWSIFIFPIEWINYEMCALVAL